MPRPERVLGHCRCVSGTCENRAFHAWQHHVWGPRTRADSGTSGWFSGLGAGGVSPFTSEPDGFCVFPAHPIAPFIVESSETLASTDQ